MVKDLPLEVLGKILVHTGLINSLKFLDSSSSILDSNPVIWNSFCDSTRLNSLHSLKSKQECLNYLEANKNFRSALLDKKEKRITFETYQQEMTQIKVNNLIYTSSDDRTLNVFDLKGKLIKKFTGHSGGIWTFDLNMDNLLVITGSTDRTVKIWDWTGVVHRTLTLHTSTVRVLKYHCKHIITGGRDCSIGVWDWSGELLHVLKRHTGSVRCLALSGDILVSGSYDGNVISWDYKKGKFLKVLHKHEKRVYAVKIFNNHVASGGLDNDLKVSRLDGMNFSSFKFNSSIAAWIDFHDIYVVCSSLDGTTVKYNYISHEAVYVIKENCSTIKGQKLINDLLVIALVDQVKVYCLQTGLYLRTIFKGMDISKIEADGHKIIIGYMSQMGYKITMLDFEQAMAGIK